MANAAAYFATRATKSTTPLYCLTVGEAQKFIKSGATKPQQGWLKAHQFVAKAGRTITLPAPDGSLAAVLLVRPTDITPWTFAALPLSLPEGRYELQSMDGVTDLPGANELALGWALGQYKFDLYKENKNKPRTLVWPAGIDRKRVLRLAVATYLVRDLINTPANDMGPAELAAALQTVADKNGAKTVVTKGKKLLERFPTVHAVGRASSRAPLYLDMRWGNVKHPKVTIVGKGVVFDTGGLDLKPPSSMLTMKKDMGGAAHAIALAGAIMDAKLPVRLRLIVPAVENAVGADAFRPLDVITTKKGLTVEVGNTDAEGRLILCDALTHASEEKPEFILDFATLTGAARVALGAELPALFCNDELLAAEYIAGGQRSHDQVWRLPLYADYDRHLASDIADLRNVSTTRFGGAITAALFLQRFVPKGQSWAHIDVMAYNSSRRPGRPRGGEAMALRAAYDFIEMRYSK